MLGTRIAVLRILKGLSQAELAIRLNISASALGMYEQGRRSPSLDTIVRLAQEFHVSTDYLLTGTECCNVHTSSIDQDCLSAEKLLRLLKTVQ